ncbi:MAG: transcriptional regulator [Phycisphaerales bacterium]|nr:MAG: transcriptional regulator [Phycisphaerales bacterium]
MMTSVSKRSPASPAAAARRRSPLDRRLDTELFKALADPTRAKLLACLIKCGRACSVSEVAECCAVDFSVVARHLGTLARAGLLSADKQGRTVWYAARSSDLSERLRALAEAIEAWPTTCNAPACQDGNCCDAKH